MYYLQYPQRSLVQLESIGRTLPFEACYKSDYNIKFIICGLSTELNHFHRNPTGWIPFTRYHPHHRLGPAASLLHIFWFSTINFPFESSSHRAQRTRTLLGAGSKCWLYLSQTMRSVLKKSGSTKAIQLTIMSKNRVWFLQVVPSLHQQSFLRHNYTF